MGIAVHRSFLTYVATVVEVEADGKGGIRIPQVHTAVDTGIVVNPETVRQQFEGAAVFGTSIARMGEITATNGAIDQSNFNDYPVARMNESPYRTHVHIVESDAPPAGVGEPGVPPSCRLSAMRFLPRLGSASASCRFPATDFRRTYNERWKSFQRGAWHGSRKHPQSRTFFALFSRARFCLSEADHNPCGARNSPMAKAIG